MRVGPCEGGTYIKIDSHPNPIDTFNGYFDIDNIPSFKIVCFPTKSKKLIGIPVLSVLVITLI